MTRPDILFIVLDTQRADRLGCYGHEKAITPNLDRFAAGGVQFEQAIATAQWTIPSHASMFTGWYPTTHQVTQSSQGLSPDLPHMAELLTGAGYQAVGFCNNPLVGILNNGFKRGFQTFYNYAGAFPSLPRSSTRVPWPANRLLEGYTQFLRRLSYPIQNFFGRSDLAFRLSLNAWLTPLWSRFANFKGQNERSVRDVCHFLREREQHRQEEPLFLFMNLMETHLPFWPPAKHVDRVAPYFRSSKRASTIVKTWNREAFRWGAPLAKPLSDFEGQVLSDMYDAEVAYQDDYLGQLFGVLNERSRRDNTLTIIVSDHGDGLGDHSYFGHAFVAYQELVHVPLIVHWPVRLPEARRIRTTVSVRRVFHTVMQAIGTLPDLPSPDPGDMQRLTLLNSIDGSDPEMGTAYSEIFPPLNFLRAIEKHWPELIEPFGCTSLRRAIVKDNSDGLTHKLVQVDGEPNELYNVTADPCELTNLSSTNPSSLAALNQELNMMVTAWERQHEHLAMGDIVDLEDERILQHLRNLGYVD
jgi:uncharacterized sulfatase